MHKWITAKLQLLLGFIFLPITKAIADLKEDLGTSLLGIDDLLMGMRVRFTQLNLGLLGSGKKEGEIEQKGLLDYLPLIYNRPNTVLFLNSVGKLFGFDDSLRFNVVYDYAAEALRFNLLKGQAPVEVSSLLLADSKIPEEHSDYKVLEWGKMILKSPKKVVGNGEKQISYCDDMAREAMRLLGNHILLTNTVIVSSDLWTICNQAFFNDMRYFYAKEEEKNKSLPAPKVEDKTEDVADKVSVEEEMILKHFDHTKPGNVYTSDELRYVTSSEIAQYLKENYNDISINDEFVKRIDAALGKLDFIKSPRRRAFTTELVKCWEVIYLRQKAAV